MLATHEAAAQLVFTLLTRLGRAGYYPQPELAGAVAIAKRAIEELPACAVSRRVRNPQTRKRRVVGGRALGGDRFRHTDAPPWLHYSKSSAAIQRSGRNPTALVWSKVHKIPPPPGPGPRQLPARSAEHPEGRAGEPRGGRRGRTRPL
jgi:hypothetical protein